MKRYRLDGSGSIEGLTLEEAERPCPGRHDVLVRMRAASLNYLDLKILHGHFPAKTAGLVPLSDGAGEVVELGEDVTRLAVGDRVASTFLPHWIAGPLPADARKVQPGATIDGMLSEYVVFPEEALVKAPAGLTYEEVSTLPCAALTAWQLFTGARPLLPGETVLVQGSGGVSLFALQFAKLAGARVVATTSSADKAARLKALGADIVINYRDMPTWGQAVRVETGGIGADHIVEIGEADTLEQSITAAAVNAQINLVGRPVGAPPIDPATLMRAIATYRRISVGSRTEFEAMNRAIEVHGLSPVIDRVFDFGQAPDAFATFGKRGHFGKIVIRI
ncbi:alcohol dehydrogenase [Mesorhizobium sp. L-8-10]|nr:alcohol dehydrogenase [Mesorhizobium sp. L-8-3]BCH32353.1 alcohol dehydrogenase [Mesorhizobium sp. L-8-10]